MAGSILTDTAKWQTTRDDFECILDVVGLGATVFDLDAGRVWRSCR